MAIKLTSTTNSKMEVFVGEKMEETVREDGKSLFTVIGNPLKGFCTHVQKRERLGNNLAVYTDNSRYSFLVID